MPHVNLMAKKSIGNEMMNPAHPSQQILGLCLERKLSLAVERAFEKRFPIRSLDRSHQGLDGSYRPFGGWGADILALRNA